MVKWALLAFLSAAPRHGYELKTEFETLLAGTWPLNIGQVYTTLSRLERDGLVGAEVQPQDKRPDRRVYTITDAGRDALRAWFGADDEAPSPLKDDFAMKVLLNAVARNVGWKELVRRRRREGYERLASLTALRNAPGTPKATVLLLDAALLRIEADLRWLDEAERSLARL